MKKPAEIPDTTRSPKQTNPNEPTPEELQTSEQFSAGLLGNPQQESGLSPEEYHRWLLSEDPHSPVPPGFRNLGSVAG